MDKDVKYFAGGDVTDTPRYSVFGNAVWLVFAVPTHVHCTIPLINDIANDFYVLNQ